MAKATSFQLKKKKKKKKSEFIFGLKAKKVCDPTVRNRLVVAAEGAHYQFNYIHIPQTDLISWKLIAAADKPACVFALHPISAVYYAL